MKIFISWVAVVMICFAVHGQKDPSSTYPLSEYKPLTLKLSEDGTKYIRFIIWHQQWLQTNNLSDDNTNLQLNALVRRSRFLAYAQVSPRFLILSHWGLNNLSTGNLSSLGNNGDGPQLFLHGAWSEFKISSNDALFVGGGLHYWNGLTRLSNQSTLNFMTLDNPRPFVHWHSLGITDQFARHLGFYLKGQMGKFDYRLAFNNPLNPANSLGKGKDYGGQTALTYTGSAAPNKDGDVVGNAVIEGYFRYNLWDTESTKLPYQVGTYLGTKKVLGVGLGFFAHPNGMYDTLTAKHGNVFHFAGDVFLDMPVGAKGDALNAYASFIRFDYGDDYMSRWAGTGTNLYGHVGYFLKSLQIMPYLAFQTGSYDAFDDNLNAFDVGVNYFVLGHNAKITLEYHTVQNNPLEGGTDESGDPQAISQLRLQLHVFL